MKNRKTSKLIELSGYFWSIRIPLKGKRTKLLNGIIQRNQKDLGWDLEQKNQVGCFKRNRSLAKEITLRKFLVSLDNHDSNGGRGLLHFYPPKLFKVCKFCNCDPAGVNQRCKYKNNINKNNTNKNTINDKNSNVNKNNNNNNNNKNIKNNINTYNNNNNNNNNINNKKK